MTPRTLRGGRMKRSISLGNQYEAGKCLAYEAFAEFKLLNDKDAERALLAAREHLRQEKETKSGSLSSIFGARSFSPASSIFHGSGTRATRRRGIRKTASARESGECACAVGAKLAGIGRDGAGAAGSAKSAGRD